MYKKRLNVLSSNYLYGLSALILAAKTHAATNGKFSPDAEDVQAVATSILRHRIIKNYKAEAEGITDEQIIKSLF